MIVTASERQTILKLLNVSEAARQLGVDVFRLHRDIKSKKLSAPKVHLGKRLYFCPNDLERIRTYYTEGRNNEF